MDEERNEVYERIPWETLERQSGDRQWWIVAVAAAVALGALAYSFMKSQSPPAPQTTPVAESAPAPTVTALTSPSAPTTTVQSPVVMAEADLYAVDPERLLDQAAAQAEWFAIEYFSVDGSEESRTTLQMLLPAGVPLPEPQEGVQVFVDWVGARSIAELSPLEYRVDVVVRSLKSVGEAGFVRQPTQSISVDVGFGDDGTPRVIRPPSPAVVLSITPARTDLVTVPAEVQAQIETSYGSVVGGTQQADGKWSVVAMVEGSDGVRRPITVQVP